MKSIWKYNKITGCWAHERGCLPDNELEWLEVFQKDEPDEFFKLSKNKPSTKPNKNRYGK